MTAMATSFIPLVDFSAWSLQEDQPSAQQVNDLAAQLHEAFSSIGFAYLTNHGVPQHLLEDIHAKMDSFFALPRDVKSRYGRRGDENHGYVALEQESLNPERPGDFKECYNITPLTAKAWPDSEVPGFQDTMMNFFSKCCELSHRVLRLMAIGLGMQNEYFFSETHHYDKDNVTTVRCLQYPPLPSDAGALKGGQIRCGEHSDYGSITLLFQDEVGGLEVQCRAGEYVPAVPVPGAVLINIGDLMQRWTADKLISTKHRVRIPEEETKKCQGRQSVAFFVHPDNDVLITCTDGSNKYPPITSMDYLKMRFSATY